MDLPLSSERLADGGLVQFRRELAKAYGDRLERAVLYGSRARGDAPQDSDYDIAVFLKDLPNVVSEAYRLADIATDILDEFGMLIHAMPFRAGTYVDRTPIMHEIRRDGRDL